MFHRTWSLIALLLCLLSLALPSLAAETGSQPRSALQGVAALEKPVTYTETKIPLGELVLKVAADTGARLTAAREVAVEPVAVVVKEMPARELLEQVAELLDYRWRRHTKGGAASYEIWQDLASKQNEEALRQAQLAAEEQRFRDEVALYSKMSHLSQAEIQSILDGPKRRVEEWMKLSPAQQLALSRAPVDPARLPRIDVAQRLTTPLSRALAGVLGHLSAQQWADLHTEQQLVFSTDPQPGELPLPAEDARRFREAPLTTLPVGAQVNSLDAGEFERVRQHDQQLHDQWKEAAGYRVMIYLSPPGLATLGSLLLNASVLPIQRPDASPVEFSGGYTHLSIMGGLPGPRMEPAEDTPERRAALDSDPVFGARRSFRPEAKPQDDFRGPGSGSGWSFRELLPDLARSYHVGFIADAYGRGPLVTPAELADLKTPALWEILQRCLRYGFHWDRRGELVRLRHRSWFIERPREIPLRLIRHWHESYDRQGALPLEEYLRMVTDLSDDQLQNLENLGNDAGRLTVPPDLARVYAVRRVLRLYAALSREQRQMVWQEHPITFARLAAVQRPLFLSAWQEHYRYSLPPPRPEDAMQGGFSIQPVRQLRIRERTGGAFIEHDESAMPPPSGTAPGAREGSRLRDMAPPAADGGSGTPSVRPGPVTRFVVIELMFTFHLGNTGTGYGAIAVAPPS